MVVWDRNGFKGSVGLWYGFLSSAGYNFAAAALLFLNKEDYREWEINITLDSVQPFLRGRKQGETTGESLSF